jgi:hypothetical protein
MLFHGGSAPFALVVGGLSPDPWWFLAWSSPAARLFDKRLGDCCWNRSSVPLRPPWPAMVAGEVGMEVVFSVWFWLGRTWRRGRRVRDAEKPLLLLPATVVVLAAAGFLPRPLKLPLWRPVVWVSDAGSGGFSPGAPLRRLMVVSSHHGVGPKGSRAAAPPLLDSVHRCSPALRPQVACSPVTPSQSDTGVLWPGGLGLGTWLRCQAFLRVLCAYSWTPV